MEVVDSVPGHVTVHPSHMRNAAGCSGVGILFGLVGMVGTLDCGSDMVDVDGGVVVWLDGVGGLELRA